MYEALEVEKSFGTSRDDPRAAITSRHVQVYSPTPLLAHARTLEFNTNNEHKEKSA